MSSSVLQNIQFKIEDFSKLIPIPDSKANKYSRGNCYVFAGSKKYPGAAVLTSLSAEKCGAGYVSLYTDPTNMQQIAINYPTIPVGSKYIPINEFIETIKKPTCVVVGPGFNPKIDKNITIVNEVCKNIDAPVLIDGGAFSALRCDDVLTAINNRKNHNRDTILTPHYGEAKQILNYLDVDKDDSLIQEEISYMISNKLNCVCVLKGPDTYVCDSTKYYCYKDGGPELSVAGSGDVLAGIIGSLVSTAKIDVFSACCLGVEIHGRAGKIAKNKVGPISVTALDVINNLPYSLNYYLHKID